MEQLLRSEKLPSVTSELPPVTPQITDVTSGNVWDLSAPLLYFPVRHHSPACAFHLQKAIAAYQPDCILIEGPEMRRK